jgi:beta-glucanase (GH16 family)
MLMKKFRRRSLSVIAMSACLAFTGIQFPVIANAETDAADDGYSLVWSDEFEDGALNTSDWNVEQHEPGWVNAELQRYTSLDEGNIEVRDGNLVIKPHVTEPEVSEEEESSEPAEVKETDVDFTVDFGAETSESIAVQINFGLIGDGFEGTSGSANVTISEVSLKDITDEENVVEVFSSFDSSWMGGVTSPAAGSYSFDNGAAYLTIENAGDQNWNFQIQKTGITFETGHKYSFHMKASSDADRSVELSALDPDNNYAWYGGTKAVIEGSAAQGNGGSAGSGKREITSGRITTQNKHDFTYGRFEARAKVPAGQGYLPAFWLMATDEGFYGQWPKCGEIDIMEVMGQNTSKSYHTIHYGYSAGTGHKENQGTKVLSEGSFSDEFHTYTLDWDPGKLTWYVDGEEVYTTSDWYTGTDDDNQVTYPAPFDQDFYIILNLAVGGNWVGYPNEEVYADMNNQAYEIDYVRVYQKSAEEYERLEAECKRPEKEEVKFREADETGNFVINGDFAKEIGIDGDASADKDNWKFHTESDAAGATYAIKDNSIKVTPEKAGSQNHSVQLKQENIPMYKGWEYEFSFDAVADEERDIVIDVEGPDRGWTRYMQDTTVRVGTTKQSYSYTFTMNDKNDPNGSLEFNFGKNTPASAVTISNVRLTHKSGDEIVDDNAKVIRPDGNYIYNGSFDQGDRRLGYWEFDEEDAQYISVTNSGSKRELKVTVPEGKSVTVKQSELSPIGKGQYELSFNARFENGAADGLTVNMAGNSYVPELTDTDVKFSKKLNYDEDLDRAASNVELRFEKAGTYYLDNIFFTESALIKNGSFNAGMASFNPYIDSQVKANYVVDNMNGNDNTFAITIEDTVAESAANDWYVQLNQDGVTLEQGKSYRLSLRMKSSIERKVKYCMQQFEGDWANYSGNGPVTIGPEWQTFTTEFKMEYPTDTKTRFNVTMGSIDGERISQQHDVFIDDISLVEIEEISEEPEEPENPDDPQDPQDPQNPDDPGNDDPSVEPQNPDQPGTDPTVEPENPDQPNEPDEPQPQEPVIIIPPVIQIIAPVVKVVKKIVVTVFSILRRLFW